MANIRWPGNESSGYENWIRRDELWRHSCFEVFGAEAGHAEYYEGNFATSGGWAAYGFSSYRDGMRTANEIEIVAANWRKAEKRVDLNAHLKLPHDLADADWVIGLSAVIEETDGNKSYWALRHPPGKPDFHHPDCFALELPALGQP